MKGSKMGQHGARGGKVRQDGSGESQITDADLAEFMRLKNGGDATARQAFLFIIGHRRVGKDSKPLNVSGDMRLYPAKYGFADSAAAAEWQAQVELAK
jgi:hypothetical protein